MTSKIKYTTTITYFIITIMTLFACNIGKENDIGNIVKKKKELILEFKDKTVFKSRGKNLIILKTYHDKLVNSFFFDVENDSLIYRGERIQFSRICGDETNCRKNAVEQASHLLHIMDSANIDQFSSDFNEFGGTVKIYLKKGGALLFVENYKNVKNQEWVNYIKNASKIDDKWYFSEN